MKKSNVTDAKAKLYKTARALRSYTGFSAGEFVSIRHDVTDLNGNIWFVVNETVVFPSWELADFTL